MGLKVFTPFPLFCPLQMITVNALLFPSSITNSLIAVGNDGLQERDRMVRACIAIVCELGGWHAYALSACCWGFFYS